MKQLLITLILCFVLFSLNAQTSVWVSKDGQIESVEARIEILEGYVTYGGAKHECKVTYIIREDTEEVYSKYYTLTMGHVKRNNKIHKIVKTDTLTPDWFWRAIFTKQIIEE